MKQTDDAGNPRYHLDQLHTTALGAERIRRNLALSAQDVMIWCKEKVQAPHASILKNGKNWYVAVDDCVITINATSYTVITAHPKKASGG